MSDTERNDASLAAPRVTFSSLGAARLVVGLAQGVLLWFVHQSIEPGRWMADEPRLFVPMLLLFGYAPIVLLGGMGRLRATALVIWTACAALALAGLGYHHATTWAVGEQQHGAWGSNPFPLFAFTAAALFIAHHLILPAQAERRWIASYPAYFDTAWKAGVQLALSVAFTGAFWVLLTLGSALFEMIGLRFLEQLIQKDWFYIPVTGLVFSIAVHLTDVSDGLIRGVRSVALMLLSWLLPVMALLSGGFLAALPFTGLDALWETGSATALVLSAAAALIILLNAGYQDGRPDNLPPSVLRLAARAGALLIAPLVGIAIWGLLLRIGQYGLTPDRIIAAACALVGAVYGAGYAFAALGGYHRAGRWMQPLERTNVWAGALAVLLIVLLFSPLMDPARLSVADQVRRLDGGAVPSDRFDYRFLRFESGRYGREALVRLAQSNDNAIATRAREAQALAHPWEDRQTGRPGATPVIEVIAGETALPADFTGAVTPPDARLNCTRDNTCLARVTDLDGDGAAEVLVVQQETAQLWTRDRDGNWAQVGIYRDNHYCPRGGPIDLRESLRSGELAPRPNRWPELSEGAGALHFEPRQDCP